MLVEMEEERNSGEILKNSGDIYATYVQHNTQACFNAIALPFSATR